MRTYNAIDIHQIQGDPWQNLAAAIIERAYIDFVEALAELNESAALTAKADLRVLLAKWTELDADIIIRHAREQAEMLRRRRIWDGVRLTRRRGRMGCRSLRTSSKALKNGSSCKAGE